MVEVRWCGRWGKLSDRSDPEDKYRSSGFHRSHEFRSSIQAADHDAAVVSAEAEAVGDRPADTHLAGGVRHVIQVALGVGRTVVDRRVNDAVLDRQRCGNQLDAA